MIKKESNYFRNFLILFFIVIFGILVYIFYMSEKLSIIDEKNIRRDNLINYPKDKPIKIGIVWPFQLPKDDNYFKEGILLALDEINKKKVLGRKVKVIFKSDNWEIDDAKSIASEFARDKDILAVIAHDDSTLAIPASITYEYNGIIMIAPAVSYPKFTRKYFKYIFRNTPSDITIGEAIANISTILNYRKMVVLNSRDAYSETLRKIFTKKAIQNGIEVIYDYKFDSNEKNFLKILTDISPETNKKIDYDAIFIAGDEENVPLFIKKARERGIYAPFITGDMLDSPALLDIGDAANNTIVATIYNDELLNYKTQKFINKFKKQYGIMPDTWAAQGYDAMMLLISAINKVGSLDPSLIANQLRYTRNYNSIFGKYSLTEQGDVKNRKIHFKIIKNGKFSYLKF